MTQLTHKINRLAYGDFFPGVVNPLDGYILSMNFLLSYVWYGFMTSLIVLLNMSVLFSPAVHNGHSTRLMQCINISSRSVD